MSRSRIVTQKTVDPEQEQYFPIVEKADDGIRVTVGSELHAMEEEHHIQWIEIVADDMVYRRFLRPGDVPEAFFRIDAQKIRARAYCIQHGLCIERKSTT